MNAKTPADQAGVAETATQKVSEQYDCNHYERHTQRPLNHKACTGCGYPIPAGHVCQQCAAWSLLIRTTELAQAVRIFLR